MNISTFMSAYRNHPVLFVGTGVSLRYLKNSYTWDGLLSKVSFDFMENEEFYLNIKSKHEENGIFNFELIALTLEKLFNEKLESERNGKFSEINDIFFEKMRAHVKLSRFKIYISKLLENLEYRDNVDEEISELKKARKNIGSIVTTNYDCLIESIFDFTPIIGNEILLSNPYGSAYKIHGCISDPDKIIITSADYKKFEAKYELIRAQLLSLFIHNPIVFLGYNIGDQNIKDILKTIYTYVDSNSEIAEKIRKNFLLVEYEAGSTNQEISEHDIDMHGFSTIRINKVKTNDFISIYKSLANLTLPISAMDVRKVQTIVKEIYSGGEVKVKFTEDMDTLNNSDKIIVIGSANTITYVHQTIPEMISNYFKIIEESNSQLLILINKHHIQPTQFFPSYGFGKICNDIAKIDSLRNSQKEKLTSIKNSMPERCKNRHTNIESIVSDTAISATYKCNAIFWATMEHQVSIEDFESYLKNCSNKHDTNYKKLLCAYDYIKYSEE